MQSAGMTFIIAMIVLYALFHLFWVAPIWIRLIVLSPLLWSLGRLLWAVYKRLGWEIKRRRMATRSQRP
jgi:hypothetical protein